MNRKKFYMDVFWGDGNLNIHKRAKNATFSYTCIDKETVEKVASYFTKDFFGKVSFC